MSTAARSAGSVLWAIARSGAGSVACHRLRSTVTIACVVALLLPLLVEGGVANGLRGQIERAARAGPDVHVGGTRYGRPAPIPLEAAERLRTIPGVTAVVPRVVGELRIGAGQRSAVVVGLPRAALPAGVACVSGRLFADGALGELVVGSQLARELGLEVGDTVPPFFRNDAGEKVTRVVGVFRSHGPAWQAHVLFVSLETAWMLFAENGTATSLLVRCPPQYREPVAVRVRSLASLAATEGAPPIRPDVTTRDDLEALLLRRVLERETRFQLPLGLAIALGVPIVLVTSGAGLSVRRREAGLLRAVGWSQDQLLVRALVESVLLAAGGAAAAVLLACLWLGALDGAGIAPVLLPGAERSPGFRVPWDLGGVPVLLAALLAAVLVGAGTLASTWRYVAAAPAEAMR